MSLMTVYHGGYQAVEKPEIRIDKHTEAALKCLTYRSYEEVQS
jgi:hypothetical protein